MKKGAEISKNRVCALGTNCHVFVKILGRNQTAFTRLYSNKNKTGTRMQQGIEKKKEKQKIIPMSWLVGMMFSSSFKRAKPLPRQRSRRNYSITTIAGVGFNSQVRVSIKNH